MALAALLVATLAGCTPSPGVQRVDNAPTAAVAGPGPDQRRAVAEADTMLAAFVAPPGASRLPGAPGGSWWEADGTPGGPTPSYSVRDTSWWRVSGQPQAIASWEKAHAPRGFTAVGGPYLLGPVASWIDMFGLPPVTGVLPMRELLVQAITNHPGLVYIRVEALVTWSPDRLASSRIPTDARTVTISALVGPGRPGQAGGPVTVTNEGEVARLVALLNGLPVYGGPPCFPVSSDGIRLLFRNASGQVVAAAAVPVVGCTAQLTLAGKPQPALADNSSVVPDVLRITGIRWVLS